eukprot:GEMP01044939.1.p1 GENE.GEMP01044939.1~~GEMP01044939.1.p1  ORF type:complete len:259 (+),score=35.95 GEMP01044939.1:107-883(+)
MQLPPTMPIEQNGRYSDARYSETRSWETVPMLQNTSLPATFANAGRRFGGIWKLFFFIAAACVIGASVVGFFAAVAEEVSIFDIINQIYLGIFGLLMLVIDFPLEHPKVVAIRLSIYKYLLFMTRFTGRGIWYLFLSCLIMGALFENGLCDFVGFVLGGYVAVVGLASTVKGILKSIKLERVRVRVNQRINELAALVPPGGMTKDQFGAMATELVADSKFTDEDLNYIVNALSFTVRSDDVISRREFAEWTRGSMTFL